MTIYYVLYYWQNNYLLLHISNNTANRGEKIHLACPSKQEKYTSHYSALHFLLLLLLLLLFLLFHYQKPNLPCSITPRHWFESQSSTLLYYTTSGSLLLLFFFFFSIR
ncbi:hypothetical protein L873DRAFT_1322913 [Choiromyces venosus 120613-1]|uniref:Uncharacterized protein n=1 Tax=Choiromyces venosus 120613-1 TaxID=1336337 RepID=A0A3N4JE92_9PEZI|nr:hypothetical protein L873DRAFT_1322913 [Choiromyces venosus 120613-1]